MLSPVPDIMVYTHVIQHLNFCIIQMNAHVKAVALNSLVWRSSPLLKITENSKELLYRPYLSRLTILQIKETLKIFIH